MSSFLRLRLIILILVVPSCYSCCVQHLRHGANSSITHQLGLDGGTNVTDGLKRYLARFGYVSDDPSDDDGQHLVRLYQSTLGLPVTGRLDNVTLDLLATPRCGVPDLHATARFAFFAGQPRWAPPCGGAGHVQAAARGISNGGAGHLQTAVNGAGHLQAAARGTCRRRHGGAASGGAGGL
jgi:hypothetical protein